MAARTSSLVNIAAILLMLATLWSPEGGAVPCQPPVVVTGHGVPEPVVAELSDLAPSLFEDVAARLRLVSCAPIHVDLLPGIEGADELNPPWQLPAWAAGAADPTGRRIVVAVTAGGRRQERIVVLHHELAHLGVREAAGGVAVPRWLDEGFARMTAGEHSAGDLAILARARVADRLLPLDALTAWFPDHRDLAALAYAQAGRAVSLLEAQRDGAVALVLARLAAGSTADDALAETVGRRTWQLDVDVARSIPLWRAWAVLGWETDLAMGLAALVCAGAGVRARRRMRMRMAGLAALEAHSARSLPPADVVLWRWTVPREARRAG